MQRGALSFGFTSSDFDGCLCQLSGVIYNSLPEERGGLSERYLLVSSVRSSYSHPDLLLITTTPLFQITPVLNTGLSLSEPLQLYKGYDAI